MSFDRFHENADRIHRIVSPQRNGNVATVPGPLGPAMREELPQVVDAARFASVRQALISHGDRRLVEDGLLRVDAGFLSIFTFPLLRGEVQTALRNPNSVVLTREMAHRYFGDVDPLGRTLRIDWSATGGETIECTVTGVAGNVPDRSHIGFNFLLPWLDTEHTTSWRDWAANTYLLLAPGIRPEAIDELEAQVADRWGEYRLQPLVDVHLNPGESRQLNPAGDVTSLYVLSSIAGVILLIACINSANLGTALSASRHREIGVRKVVGADRRQLAIQLWGEAIATSALACALGVALAELLLPLFNRLTGHDLTVELSGFLLLSATGLALAVGVVSGGYPVLMLSRLHAVEVMKGRLTVRTSSPLGRGLIVLQFGLAVVFAVAAVVMSQQFQLLREARLGFDREHVVVVLAQNLPRNSRAQVMLRYADEIRRHSGVVSASRTMATFGRGTVSFNFRYGGRRAELYDYAVDAEYLKTLGIQLLEGQGFSERAGSREEGLIVNETFSRFDLDGTDGEVLRDYLWDGGPPRIQGVVADYNFQSLHHTIAPVVLRRLDDQDDVVNSLLVRLRPDGSGRALELLRQTWEEMAPERPFEYSFLDDDIQRQYAAERRWYHVALSAAGLALLLACLGLLGLSSLAVAHRSREIGIRKVLGSSVPRVLLLLVGDAGRLVIVASLVALPLSYLAVRQWLEAFAYRVDLSVVTFVAVAFGVLALAVVTTGFQALKGALTNPVEVLRYE